VQEKQSARSEAEISPFDDFSWMFQIQFELPGEEQRMEQSCALDNKNGNVAKVGKLRRMIRLHSMKRWIQIRVDSLIAAKSKGICSCCKADSTSTVINLQRQD